MHDITIRNGRIIDGSGAPEFRGDIGIDGEGQLSAYLAGYADGNLDPQRTMIRHPYTRSGLRDARAHVGGCRERAPSPRAAAARFQ